MIRSTLLLGSLAVLLCGWVTFAEKPRHTTPDLAAPFMGVGVGHPEDLAKRIKMKAKVIRKGVFVSDLHPDGPAASQIPTLSLGDLITKVNGVAVESPEAFTAAFSTVKVGDVVTLDMADFLLNSNNLGVWQTTRKVTFKPMAKGAWAASVVPGTKDDFLDIWHRYPMTDARRQELIQELRDRDSVVGDPVLMFQHKDGVATKLRLQMIFFADDWLFIDEVSIKVGESVYKVSVTPKRTVTEGASVCEFIDIPVEGALAEAVRDLAFTDEEAAIAFHGRDSNEARPISAERRREIVVTTWAYLENKGKGLSLK